MNILNNMTEKRIAFIKNELKEITEQLIRLENKLMKRIKVPAQDILELRRRVETLERKFQELQPA